MEEKSEEDNNVFPSNEKEVTYVKGKGKGRKIIAHASSQVSICSFTKALVQRTTAPTTTVVRSPTATPSALAPYIVAAPSQSRATIPLVPHKNKVVESNTSVVSLEKSSSLSFIKNVDMEELIQDFIKTKVPLQLIATYKNS